MVAHSLLLSSLRFFWHHPWQFGLTLLGIALGSAVMIAVDLANQSARASFSASVDTVAGRATHSIVGSAHGFPEAVYTQLKRQDGHTLAAPVVTGRFDCGGQACALLGTDPFASLYRQSQGAAAGLDTAQILTLLTVENSGMLSPATAARLNLVTGDVLDVRVGEAVHALTITVAPPHQQETVPDNILVTDIATAQRVLSQPGQIDRIDVALPDPQAVSILAETLEAPLRLEESATRTPVLEQMTRAFRTNLTAMSLLAMLVSAFLVYNTMTFSVLQRRQVFAIKRMMGVTGWQLGRHIVIEALLFALIGAAVGCLLGVLLGQGLLLLMTRTISDLYARVDYAVLLVQPLLLVKGVGLTTAAVLLATIGPALEAARVAPVQVHRRSDIELRVARRLRVLPMIGCALILLGALLLVASARDLVVGLLAMFLIIIGYSLCIPLLTSGLLRALRVLKPVASQTLMMALRGIEASRSRTMLAIVALAIAISATVGVSVMISAFRVSVANWLDDTLQSDVYIAHIGDQERPEADALDPSWPARVRQLPGVAAVSTGQSLTARVAGTPLPLLVLEPGRHSQGGFRLLEGDREATWQQFTAGETVLISESLAWNRQLAVGDVFTLDIGDVSSIAVTVGGVYRDYSASQGMLVMVRKHYTRFVDDNRISTIGVLFEPNADKHALQQELAQLVRRTDASVDVRFNSDIKARSLAIFDRTFAITGVLRVLVIVVAFVGVFSALMALSLERTREFAVLRATGMTARQLAGLVLLQTALTGLVAGILALPAGWAMSEILIHVINQRSFGWTMARYFPWFVVPQALALAVVAALLAGLYPVRQVIRNPISRGLRAL